MKLYEVKNPANLPLKVIETKKYFFFVMEHVSRGELSDYIESSKKLPEEEACKYFQQLMSAIDYLHKLGFAHRDIKPSNILLDEDFNVKLIDFGLGNLYSSGEQLLTACGSPCYAAPEVYLKYLQLSLLQESSTSL